MNNKDTQLKKKFEDKFVRINLWRDGKGVVDGIVLHDALASEVWDFIHSTLESERKQLEREIIKKIDYIFKDHYWDSFEPDRELLLKHWKFILDLLRPLHNVI